MSYADRMARADGCPTCVRNYEVPRHVHDAGPDGFCAHYRCSDCGRCWHTSWMEDC